MEPTQGLGGPDGRRRAPHALAQLYGRDGHEGRRPVEDPAHAEGPARPVEEQQRPKRKPSRKVRLAIAVGALVVAGAALAWWLHARQFESTDDAQVDADITAVSPRVAGTVTAVHVIDNQEVRQGDLLVELDPTDFRVALEQARASVQQAESKSTFAKSQRVRAEQLLRGKTIPPDAYDQRTSAAGQEQAGLLLARARLREAELALGYTRVSAPVAGLVGKKAVNVGDRVQPGTQLLMITQTQRQWVTANFRETQLKRIQPGQRATVHVDAIDVDFKGEVESVAGATGARYSLLPPENATGNYVKVVQRIPVRIRLDPGQPGLERLRPGMSVEPKVTVR
jgi:membrane fusion protein (multidrug efflux system)